MANQGNSFSTAGDRSTESRTLSLALCKRVDHLLPAAHLGVGEGRDQQGAGDQHDAWMVSVMTTAARPPRHV